MSQFGFILTFLPGSLSSWQGWSPFSSDLPPAFSFLLSLLLLFFLVFHSKINQRCASVKLLSRSASLQSAPSSQLSLSLLFLSSSIFSHPPAPTPAPRSSPLNGGRWANVRDSQAHWHCSQVLPAPSSQAHWHCSPPRCSLLVLSLLTLLAFYSKLNITNLEYEIDIIFCFDGTILPKNIFLPKKYSKLQIQTSLLNENSPDVPHPTCCPKDNLLYIKWYFSLCSPDVSGRTIFV